MEQVKRFYRQIKGVTDLRALDIEAQKAGEHGVGVTTSGTAYRIKNGQAMAINSKEGAELLHCTEEQFLAIIESRGTFVFPVEPEPVAAVVEVPVVVPAVEPTPVVVPEVVAPVVSEKTIHETPIDRIGKLINDKVDHVAETIEDLTEHVDDNDAKLLAEIKGLREDVKVLIELVKENILP